MDPLIAYAQCGTCETRTNAAAVLRDCVAGQQQLTLHATKQGAVKCAGWLLQQQQSTDAQEAGAQLLRTLVAAAPEAVALWSELDP